MDRGKEKAKSKSDFCNELGISLPTFRRWLNVNHLHEKLDQVQPKWRSSKVFTPKASRLIEEHLAD